MRIFGMGVLMCVAVLSMFAAPAAAQDAPAGGGGQASAEDAARAEPVDLTKVPPDPLEGVTWEQGPKKGRLGTLSEVGVPAGWWFTGAEGTRALMKAMQNPVNGEEVGLIAPPIGGGEWFVVFQFSAVGYVADDEREELDANEMLDSMREGMKRSNEKRKQMGWGTLDLVGWEVPPHYDVQTNHLAWALRFKDERGAPVVNYNVRLLGRTGVMSAEWVGDPADLPGALPRFRSLVEAHEFVPGRKYAEYKKGDHVAEYGLAGLIAGGAVAAAAKTGLLQKFWKVIVLAFAAVAGFFKKLFGGGKEKKPRRSTARRVRTPE